MARSGVSCVSSAPTASLFVMSTAFRSSGRIVCPGGQAARQTSRPICPPAPNTTIFIAGPPGLRSSASDLLPFAKELIEIGDGAGEPVLERGGGLPGEQRD